MASDDRSSSGTPGPSDRKVNTLGPRTKGIWGRMPNPDFVFGTDAEIDLRGDDAALAGRERFRPEATPAAFKQIAPEVSRGQSVNRAPLQRRAQSGRYNEDRGGPGRP